MTEISFRFPVFFGSTAYPCGAALDSLSCDYSHQFTAVGDLNEDGLPDLVVYVIDKFGTVQIRDEGEIDVLLNDSFRKGFEALPVSSGDNKTAAV